MSLPPYACFQCPLQIQPGPADAETPFLSFNTLREMAVHMAVSHLNKVVYSCTLCNENHGDKPSLIRHCLRIHYGIEDEEEEDGDEEQEAPEGDDEDGTNVMTEPERTEHDGTPTDGKPNRPSTDTSKTLTAGTSKVSNAPTPGTSGMPTATAGTSSMPLAAPIAKPEFHEGLKKTPTKDTPSAKNVSVGEPLLDPQMTLIPVDSVSPPTNKTPPKKARSTQTPQRPVKSSVVRCPVCCVWFNSYSELKHHNDHNLCKASSDGGRNTRSRSKRQHDDGDSDGDNKRKRSLRYVTCEGVTVTGKRVTGGRWILF